jgi:hypothetical protein
MKGLAIYTVIIMAIMLLSGLYNFSAGTLDLFQFVCWLAFFIPVIIFASLFLRKKYLVKSE